MSVPLVPIRAELPRPIAKALAALFPTLAWERVRLFVGIPWPFSLGSEIAITLPAGHSGIGIYFRPGRYEPYEPRFFLLCVHELVHALQVVQSPAEGKGLGLLNAFIFHYLTCYFCAWSAAPRRGNLYEDEAYDHEALVARALAGGADATALARVDPRVIKKKARVKGTCGTGASALGAALMAALVLPPGAIVYAIAGLVSRLTGRPRGRIRRPPC